MVGRDRGTDEVIGGGPIATENKTTRDLRTSCIQPAVVEPTDNVLNCHMIQSFTDGVVQFLPRPRRHLAKLALELRSQLLDRVVVGAIRREAQDLRSRLLNRRCHAGGQMGFKVLEHHDVSGIEFRC